jgi:hypothetical protein
MFCNIIEAIIFITTKIFNTWRLLYYCIITLFASTGSSSLLISKHRCNYKATCILCLVLFQSVTTLPFY